MQKERSSITKLPTREYEPNISEGLLLYIMENFKHIKSRKDSIMNPHVPTIQV